MLTHARMVALGADSAEAALSLATLRKARIDLLLCDVILPGLSGPDLAQEFLQFHPESRCLFMAGLPDTPEISKKILARGLPFLPKPFLPTTLVQKIRDVLGSEPGATMAARA